MVLKAWFGHGSIYERLISHYEKENARTRQEYNEITRLSHVWLAEFETHTDNSSSSAKHDTHCEGDLRLKKLRYLLDHAFDHLGWERSEAQVEFHDAFIQATLPKIYGSDWDAHSARVLAQFGIKEVKQLVLCMTPRRFGKSTGVGCFVACLLCVVPGMTCSTFSTGKRASTLLMDNLKRVLVGLEGGSAAERIVKESAEQLVLSEAPIGGGLGNQSKSAKALAVDARSSVFHSFPSNPDGQYSCTL